MRSNFACGGVLAAVLMVASCSAGDAPGASLSETMPKVVAGKWRVTIMVDGDTSGMASNFCRPETAIDDIMMSGLAGNGRNCAERTFEQASETVWQLHSVCNFMGTGDRKADTVVTIDTRVSGDLTSHYQAESKQVFSKPMNGVSQQTILQKAERVGDCTPS